MGTDREDGRIQIRPVAHIRSDFHEKFGIPRQSGLVSTLESRIVFEEPYRDPNAFKGLEEFSHIWILWEFSENVEAGWSPTVIPPRLGGRVHKGVFATRSPFRPNPIGLSCVRLKAIGQDPKDGPVLIVLGADLMDGTPVYDIKPYVAYTDCHPEAVCSFADRSGEHRLEVAFPEELLKVLPQEKREAAVRILEEDPRPAYQHDPQRRYGVAFAGFDIRFHVEGDKLTVCEVVPYDPSH